VRLLVGQSVLHSALDLSLVLADDGDVDDLKMMMRTDGIAELNSRQMAGRTSSRTQVLPRRDPCR
jgi:hypothetical protein